MTYLEHAEHLRAATDRHYNCCQAVLVPFTAGCGMDEERACAAAAHFGAGMRMGGTCGAVTGGLMALGMLGAEDAQARAFTCRFREAAGHVDCAPLLKSAQEMGEARMAHCDRMVYLAVQLVEELSGLHSPSDPCPGEL